MHYNKCPVVGEAAGYMTSTYRMAAIDQLGIRVISVTAFKIKLFRDEDVPFD